MATDDSCDDASVDPLDAGHSRCNGPDLKTGLGYPGYIYPGLCCCMDKLCICRFPRGYADPFHGEPLGVVLSPFPMDWYNSMRYSRSISMEHIQTTMPASVS